VNGSEWQGIGTGWQAYGDALSQRYGPQVALCDATALPRAWDVALLAEHAYRAGAAVSAEQALPVYLRDNVVSRA
jgi:tRNA threonylcarbamoyladenosine biosynthesis protein TsaB